MLTTLRIKNLALVPDLTLAPQPGCNVFTGETGAGKTIIIGALNIDSGLRGSLETSTDLQHWTRLLDATGESSDWQTDKTDEPGQRFFRAVIRQ